jgi:hypothetical protein
VVSTPCAYRVKNRFQAFAFKCNLYRYNKGGVQSVQGNVVTFADGAEKAFDAAVGL